ncbi:MAG: metallophosphoesterase [Methanocellales archaeon]|nr:metallophosphoesterase [Methanocellales archaeon]MDD3291260.1 metallophosphoesterase [Methanocellales archaeon]MDD5235432.1 metallophosphoesterase [Methanocellales archaeon]MDD5484485.1 metallophosphoesterase [Methanocellales archaeon]
MNKRIQFVIYFLLFLLIYISLNSYVVLRLGGLLGIGRNILYLWIALATLSLPVAVYFERIFPNILSRIFYTVSALWMGILLFTLCSLLIYEVIRPFYTIPYAGMIIVIVVSVLSIISVINAVGIVVKEVEVPIKNLEEDVTLVQLSDIHAGTIRNSGFLKKIIEKANKLDPNIVMITGDMVDASARLHGSMFSDFNRLKAPIYFVTGNHEVYEETDKVYALFNDTKIRVLRNEAVDFDGIQIIGVEFSEDKGHLGKELEKLKIDKSKPAVLMYHSPAGTEDAKRAGIDLQLAGHTHSGQIFPFNFFLRMFFKHIKGLYDFEGMFLYVSPGTGTWGPYMRLGSRNEITLLKLIAK